MVTITLPNGNKVEGELMDVVSSKEPWSEYELENGTIVRIKLVVTEIYMLDEHDPATGKPNVLVKSNNVIAVKLPTER
jgi:hypothetical protein